MLSTTCRVPRNSRQVCVACHTRSRHWRARLQRMHVMCSAVRRCMCGSRQMTRLSAEEQHFSTCSTRGCSEMGCAANRCPALQQGRHVVHHLHPCSRAGMLYTTCRIWLCCRGLQPEGLHQGEWVYACLALKKSNAVACVHQHPAGKICCMTGLPAAGGTGP